MAIIPANPVRNRFGPQVDSLQIAYAATKVVDGKIKNLGRGYTQGQSKWDGTLIGTTITNTVEGLSVNLNGVTYDYVNIGADLTALRAFPTATILIRFSVDAVGFLSKVISNSLGTNIANTFYVISGNIRRDVVWRDSTTKSVTYSTAIDFSGVTQSLIITWDSIHRAAYADIEEMIPTETAGFDYSSPMIVGAGNLFSLFKGWLAQPGLTGKLHTFCMWDSVLTSAERAQLFADPYLPIRRQVVGSTPAGSRGTLIETSSDPDALQTYWEFSGYGDTFTIITNKDGTDSANVLNSDLENLNIWLMPFSEYQVRTKQILNDGTTTEWTEKTTVTARGMVNSYENYAILNANTETIPT